MRAVPRVRPRSQESKICIHIALYELGSLTTPQDIAFTPSLGLRNESCTSRSAWCWATAACRACTSWGLQAPVRLASPSSSLRHLSLHVSGSLPSWSPILRHLPHALGIKHV